MTIKEFFSFRQNKYFWINIVAMIVVVALLLFGTLKGIDIYTHHGEAVVVPDVKGMTVGEAGKVFGNRGLVCIVSDSTYVKDKPAGCILDYNPTAGQKVKEGRIIYLTINAVNIPLQEVPDVADNSSLRQAEARILASGFKLNDIRYIAGEKDWVYGVEYRERMLAMGEKVPMGATLTLVVGNGEKEVLEGDSLAVDEGAEIQETVGSGESAADESWF
ncbi:PASTA domain-containing protein [Bacteroides gallinarum]|uniref:PASTA domain-containing protein n=1 Tax=Bacteroides gallinarum TaxID=376806 RepID=UPI0003A0B5C8|nr:PASTA domain-containing protein [Bacteroides gallinarum]